MSLFIIALIQHNCLCRTLPPLHLPSPRCRTLPSKKKIGNIHCILTGHISISSCWKWRPTFAQVCWFRNLGLLASTWLMRWMMVWYTTIWKCRHRSQLLVSSHHPAVKIKHLSWVVYDRSRTGSLSLASWKVRLLSFHNQSRFSLTRPNTYS